MQVINHSVLRQLKDSQNRINPGDVTPVMIKDRVGGNEAAVIIKGQELKAQFEGAVPASDRLLAEVVGMPEKGKVILRQAAFPQASKAQESPTIDSRLHDAGIDPAKNTDLKNAVKIIDALSVPLTKENLIALQQFLNEAPGTVQEKIETVRAVAQKNLAVTAEHLKSVHSAMHGPSLKNSLLELAAGREIKFESAQGNSKPVASQAEAIRQPTSNNGLEPSLVRKIEQVVEQIKKGITPVQEIKAIAAEADKSPEIQQLKQEIIRSIQIHEAGTERISQAKGTDTSLADAKAKAVQLLADGVKLQKISAAQLSTKLENLASVLEGVSENENNDLLKLQSFVKTVQKESSMDKILHTIGQAIDDLAENKSIDLKSLEAAFEKATQLSEQGRELSARKVVAEAISQLEKDNPILQKNANLLALSEAEQDAINDSVQALNLQSKAILVTEITKKLSQMAIDFKKVKQEITKSLDHVSMIIDKSGGQANARQMLDLSINKLDHAILKSNFMLYTDMLTEKKMLTASSRLSEARNLLAKGEFSQASQIVKEVKGVLDQIIFKPSMTRVQHVVSEQSLLKSAVTMEDQVAYGIKQAVRPMPDQDYSSRQVFESLRRLGLTHENDVANNLVFGKNVREEMDSNLKSTLIKMAQDGEGNAKAEQALSSLTGQQLLNKQDSSGMQNLFMQMPFLLNQKMENIKVFINSQKSGEKIDWENCSLYFVLETKKLGEVGILVTAQTRNVSITFNSTKDKLDTILDPMTEVSKERLEEIGYNLEALKAKKTEAEASAEATEEKLHSLTPAFTEKGYDFTI